MSQDCNQSEDDDWVVSEPMAADFDDEDEFDIFEDDEFDSDFGIDVEEFTFDEIDFDEEFDDDEFDE